MGINDIFDIWKFLAGLGLFLFAMLQLEDALKTLTGRSFKIFLQKHTQHPVKSILSGTVATAVLQSSSVVSLMVLAFVGAGIIEMRNALGIIFGSNLGTTFTGWIVTLLGFKLDIQSASLPMIAFGSLGLVYFTQQKRFNAYSRLILSIGFLFFGLGLMKSSIEYLATDFDLSTFSEYGPLTFLIFGFIFTVIIQSSSATMIITLSALNADSITLQGAAAIVIGADLGTTIKVMLGAVNGIPAKRRVAMAHFLFNLTTDLIAFALLIPLLAVISDVLQFKDPLYSLVMFHSSFNLLGIFLFYPFIGYFASFLESRFISDKPEISLFIQNVPVDIPEASVQAIEKESRFLLANVMDYNSSALHLHTPSTIRHIIEEAADKTTSISSQRYTQRYDSIKYLEGEIIEYCSLLQNTELDELQTKNINQYLSSIRNMVHSAKSVKDIHHDLEEYRSSI